MRYECRSYYQTSYPPVVNKKKKEKNNSVLNNRLPLQYHTNNNQQYFLLIMPLYLIRSPDWALKGSTLIHQKEIDEVVDTLLKDTWWPEKPLQIKTKTKTNKEKKNRKRAVKYRKPG